MSEVADTDEGDTLLDQAMEKVFGGAPPEPEPEADPPEAEPEDTPPEEDPEDEDADTDDEEKEDEDDDDDEDKDEDDEEEDDDEEEESFLPLTKEEREELLSDPKLKRQYQSMQADYTRKTTEVAEREARVSRVEDAMRDPDKSADFLAGVYARQPVIAANAFARIAEGEAGVDFLVAIGVQDPKMFELAYDRARELVDDPTELKRYKDTEADKLRADKLERRDMAQKQRAFDQDWEKISLAADKEAQSLGFDEEELADLRKTIQETARVRINKSDGSIEMTTKEAKKLVKTERDRIDRIYEKAASKARRKLAKDSQDSTKRKAAGAKERVPPGPGPKGRKPVTDKPARFKAPEGVDGLDAYVDHRFQ